MKQFLLGLGVVVCMLGCAHQTPSPDQDLSQQLVGLWTNQLARDHIYWLRLKENGEAELQVLGGHILFNPNSTTWTLEGDLLRLGRGWFFPGAEEYKIKHLGAKRLTLEDSLGKSTMKFVRN